MALIHIASVTASSSATVEFTTGIDATYNEYQFHFVNMHPSADSTNFQFQVNASNDTGGGFDTSVITSTTFHALHNEDDNYVYLVYRDGQDLAQQALYQTLAEAVGGIDADMSCNGVLTLYAPSDTTYVKHFTSRLSNSFYGGPRAQDFYAAGYINQTLAIPEISFKMASGNIDAGTIHMYGVG